MRRLAWVLSALAACSSPPDGDDDVAPDAADSDGDADTDAAISCLGVCPAIDAGIDGDAAGGDWPLGSACDLLLEQCASGLTCRYTGIAGTPFSCQPIGQAGAGASCSSTADCGANMGCFGVGGGQRACMVFCDTDNPSARCNASEQCYPQSGLPPEYPDTTGVCG